MTPPVPPYAALFIDFDGTLIELADHPSAARCDRALSVEVGALRAALGGALAIVSGRTLTSLSQFLALEDLAAAGIHGLELRRADGSIVARPPVDVAGLERVRAGVHALIEADRRLFVEDKGFAIAVHYSAAAEQEACLAARMLELAQRAGPAFELQPGRAVIEVKPRGYTKGTALAEFMQQAAFRGRQPVAIGDDLSDLDAFRAAEALGGSSIAVGQRVSGRWHLPDPPALRRWLASLVDAILSRRVAY